MVPVGGSRRMGERIEGVEVEVVEGGGHNLFEEDMGGLGIRWRGFCRVVGWLWRRKIGRGGEEVRR